MKILVLVIGLLCVGTPAFAQYVDRDDSARFEDEFDEDEFAVNGRFRVVGVPGFVWGFWYDEHSNHWADGQTNFSYGGEFTWRRRGEFEIGVAFDYADLKMSRSFWTPTDEPIGEQKFTDFNIRFASLVFYTQWFWNVEKWFSPFVGVGVGPGLVIGDFTEQAPAPGSQCRTDANTSFSPDSCVDSDGNPVDGALEGEVANDDIPPVLPVIQVGGGVRFNIADYGLLKIELGFQNYLYAGIGAGAQW